MYIQCRQGKFGEWRWYRKVERTHHIRFCVLVLVQCDAYASVGGCIVHTCVVSVMYRNEEGMNKWFRHACIVGITVLHLEVDW